MYIIIGCDAFSIWSVCCGKLLNDIIIVMGPFFDSLAHEMTEWNVDIVAYNIIVLYIIGNWAHVF